MQNNWKKFNNLPQKPGVYRFLDKNGGVLYIGKAKNLRARVRQYFAGGDKRPQIPFLMKETADLDYTIVNTELESLYLERTQIQKHAPKYNIELRDDKNYAFIKINYSTKIPQIIITRKIQEPNHKNQINYKSKIPNSKTNLKSKIPALSLPNGLNHKSAYFGPYTSTKKIRDLILTARKTFGLCAVKKVGKPCFYFHLHRCPGVCAGAITINEYKKHLEKIKALFKGQTSPLIKTLKTEMAQAARKKLFEKAARLRDQLKSLELLEEKQIAILPKKVDWDVVAMSSNDGCSCVNLFKIREGKMLGKENFIYNNPNATNLHPNEPNILQASLEEYYLTASDIPKAVYLQTEINNPKLILDLLKKRAVKKIELVVPKKGKAKKLISLGQTNAEEYLKNYLGNKAQSIDKIQTSLQELKALLNLPNVPKRIEAFDISNIQGTNPVGSMVVFIDGMPAKSQYRKFKIRGRIVSAEGLPKADDFAMMREIILRRILRSTKHQETRTKDDWPIPDLMVIDGGKGQLSAAQKALQQFKILNLKFKIIGLAKRLEEIFTPGKSKPIILPYTSPALQLLQRLRDEAHRFGITFHRSLRSKQAIKSQLDEIPGLGPKTKKLLKQKFGSVANIKNAKFDELVKIIGEQKAVSIKNNL